MAGQARAGTRPRVRDGGREEGREARVIAPTAQKRNCELGEEAWRMDGLVGIGTARLW